MSFEKLKFVYKKLDIFIDTCQQKHRLQLNIQYIKINIKYN